MSFRLKKILLYNLLFLFVPIIVSAQSLVEDECENLVKSLLQNMQELCITLDGDGACVVETISSSDNLLEIDLSDVFTSTITLAEFSEQSSEQRFNNSNIKRLQLLAFEVGEPRSQLENAIDSGLIQFLFLGDIEVTDTGDRQSSPMQSFLLNSVAESGCEASNSKIFMITPRGFVFDLSVGEAKVSMEPFLKVTVTPDNDRLIERQGNQEHSFIIEVPASQRWVDTGIRLIEDNKYKIIPTEYVKTGREIRWTGSYGHLPSHCDGVFNWDCKCGSKKEQSECAIHNFASMVLVGRIGENILPLIISPNETQVSLHTGTLYLGVNDDVLSDNYGGFYVIINVEK